MRLVSGLVSETRPVSEDTLDEVVRFRIGDIVLLNDGVYAVVCGIVTNERGNKVLRLGLPKDAMKLQRWGKRNPHKVKRLEAGHRIT